MIAHPERLIKAESQIAAAFRLCREEKMPAAIQVLVLTGAFRYGLRAIYGDDLRAGCALIYQVFNEWWDVHVVACARRIRYAVPWLLSWAWENILPSWRNFVGGTGFRKAPVRCSCGWAGSPDAMLRTVTGSDARAGERLCPECAQEVRIRECSERPHT